MRKGEEEYYKHVVFTHDMDERGKIYPVVESVKEPTNAEREGLRFFLSLGTSFVIWVVIGATWGVVSLAQYPLMICLLFMWVFWVWLAVALFILTPLIVYRAYWCGVFNE